MALLGFLFAKTIYSGWLGLFDADTANNYTVGIILLAAAPNTAMVIVLSYLTDGDGPYTLAQVAINDLIMVFAFAPVVMFLVGVTRVKIPGHILFIPVLVFIVIPQAAGWLSRSALIKAHGIAWFEAAFPPKFRPVTVVALRLTLVLLLAIPILIQVYFNSSLTYLLMRLFRVRHNVAIPGALIGASNFFEPAVAVRHHALRPHQSGGARRRRRGAG